MATPNDNTNRLAANHHFDRERSSTIMVRRTRRYPVSETVIADSFRPVPVTVQHEATIAYLGARPGTVSLKVQGNRAGFTAEHPSRSAPQARLATQRDRRRILGAGVPSGHEAIGRPVISPLLLLGGSDLG